MNNEPSSNAMEALDEIATALESRNHVRKLTPSEANVLDIARNAMRAGMDEERRDVERRQLADNLMDAVEVVLDPSLVRHAERTHSIPFWLRMDRKSAREAAELSRGGLPGGSPTDE